MPFRSGLDLRDAYRSLRGSPRFTLLCVAVLGLGIGLSTAMFAAVNATLLRRLPVAEQDRIIVAWGENRERNFTHLPFRIRQAREFAEQSRTLAAVAFVDYNPAWPFTFRDGERVYSLKRALVSGSFFKTLGVHLVLGQAFDEADDRVGPAPVAVISDAVWQQQFGGERSVIGRRLTLHATGATYTVVGVAPSGLEYPRGTDIWLPILPATTYAPADTSSAIVDVVGRLRPEATRDAAEADVTAFFRSPMQPEVLRQSAGVARTFTDIVVGDVRSPLTVLSVAVALLLLVACVNVAGLLLMRGVRRGREIAVRTAVGATSGRIVRQQMLEGLILGALGAVIGVAVANGALGTLRAAAPPELVRVDEIRVDGAALVAATLIALATAVAFAVGPALIAARTDTAQLLRAGACSLSAGRRGALTREWLVAAQVTAAVVVLSATALVGRSLRELQRVELGFDKSDVVILDLAWDFTRVTSADRSLATYDALLPRLEAIPGVAAASAILLTPFSGTGGWDVLFLATDRSATEQTSNPWLNMEVVSPSYFDVFRIPLRRGRYLTDIDRSGAPGAVVLSEGAARALWPNGDALGKQLMLARADSARWTVVGIVADTRYRDYRRARETIYFAHHQTPFPLVATMLAVRSAGIGMSDLVPQIRSVIRETDPTVLLAEAVTLDAHLDKPLAQPRFNTLLLGGFSLSALLIVLVGIYAALAFAVRMRAREFAIRTAVGASPSAVRALVFRTAFAMIGAGIVAGLLVTLAVTRALQPMLFLVSIYDPRSIATGIVVLLLAAFCASYPPARAATRVPGTNLLQGD
ncbi:MAG: ADOP family duplicated permease [Gemmatimonadaceae bacterium]